MEKRIDSCLNFSHLFHLFLFIFTYKICFQEDSIKWYNNYCINVFFFTIKLKILQKYLLNSVFSRITFETNKNGVKKKLYLLLN